ncbi:MAG: P-II family nitrogen regulator [Candidatus Omnitrophica bacterium]|nr:P-II family nitrogen regulator [Candidatus Omnitrophota bacterium]
MKMITAIIQPHRLEEVKKALYDADVNLITVSEVLGHGRQKGVDEYYRGSKESGNLLRKIRLDIAVNENFVEPTIKAIIKGAKTGKIGDGKIFVVDLPQVIRIRTEERGEKAIG